MLEEKYIVMKKEDWDEYWKHTDDMEPDLLAIPVIKDCVVIRHQDVFASSAMFDYANVIQAGLELMDSLKQRGVITGGNKYGEEVRRLRELADGFMGEGERASKWFGRRVPD